MNCNKLNRMCNEQEGSRKIHAHCAPAHHHRTHLCEHWTVCTSQCSHKINHSTCICVPKKQWIRRKWCVLFGMTFTLCFSCLWFSRVVSFFTQFTVKTKPVRFFFRSGECVFVCEWAKIVFLCFLVAVCYSVVRYSVMLCVSRHLKIATKCLIILFNRTVVFCFVRSALLDLIRLNWNGNSFQWIFCLVNACFNIMHLTHQSDRCDKIPVHAMCPSQKLKPFTNNRKFMMKNSSNRHSNGQKATEIRKIWKI